MAIQNVGDYTEQFEVGIEGSGADMAGSPGVKVTGVNESEPMPYGRMVQFDAAGTTDRSVKLANAVERFLGITYFSQYQTQTGTITGVAQVTTYTVGGTATDGVYSFIVDGELISITRATTPATNNDLAAALRAEALTVTALAGKVTFSGATDEIIVTRDEAGSFSTGAIVVTGPGTLVEALTTGGEDDAIFANEAANVLRKGTIWVRPEDAVTPASGVFVRITANAGTGTALGAFRGADDGGNSEDIGGFCRWVTSSVGGAKGALAKLEINLD